MKNIFKALANFQQEVPTIHKGTKGYGYTYADLPAIFEVINPLLKKNGLGFTQLIGGESVKTIVFHIETGETLESVTKIPQNVTLKGMNDFQVLGSAITYIRRYAISSALGLVTDKDIDASGTQNKKEVSVSWLSETQFKAALQSDKKGIEATLKAFSTESKKMKKEYREQLTNKLKTI